MCVPVWGCVHVSARNQRGQRRALDPLELESQAIVKHPMWDLNSGPLQEQCML